MSLLPTEDYFFLAGCARAVVRFGCSITLPGKGNILNAKAHPQQAKTTQLWRFPGISLRCITAKNLAMASLKDA
jgi:hypothetical protein